MVTLQLRSGAAIPPPFPPRHCFVEPRVHASSKHVQDLPVRPVEISAKRHLGRTVDKQPNDSIAVCSLVPLEAVRPG